MAFELIASIGLMWILRFGSIFNPLRNILRKRSKTLSSLIDCSLCLGFWCGAAIGTVLYCFKEDNFIYFLFPFISSALCWFFDCLLDLIQNATVEISHRNSFIPPVTASLTEDEPCCQDKQNQVMGPPPDYIHAEPTVPYEIGEDFVTVFWNGKTHTIKEEDKGYNEIRELIFAGKLEDVGDYLEPGNST